jgi:hypothetical protein
LISVGEKCICIGMYKGDNSILMAFLGQITFKVFDRQLYSTERVLHIQVINKNVPELVRNEHVLATVGETTPFDHKIIELKTTDPVNTVISVIEGRHGLENIK